MFLTHSEFTGILVQITKVQKSPRLIDRLATNNDSIVETCVRVIAYLLQF